MQIDLPTLIEASAALITTIGGVYSIAARLNAKSKKKREAYRLDILNQAREEMSKIEKSLESKIKDLEIELETQKASVSKDFGHFKETYNAEVKSLADKIESLREDLSQQHQALVGLLTKLVDTK